MGFLGVDLSVFVNYDLDYVYLLFLVFSVLDQVLWVCSAHGKYRSQLL